MRLHLRQFLTYLVVGVLITVVVAWALAVGVDPGTVNPQTISYSSGNTRMNLSVWERPGASHVVRSTESGLNWSPPQATGAPDTTAAGDAVTAWASMSADGQAEWLMLDYEQAVVPQRIDVYESYKPGALVRMTVFTSDGKEVEVWQGTDPTPTSAAMGVSKIPVSVDFKTKRVKLYIDSPAVAGWNEIDAVGLVGEDGKTQWASDAQASSWYDVANGPTLVSAAVAETSVPSWAQMEVSGGARKFRNVAIDARGWPMLAMSSERNPTAATAMRVPHPAVIPLRPIWSGLLVDSLVYGAAVWVMWLGLSRPRRFVREVGRMKQGRCMACGYDLNFRFEDGCPECGWRRGRLGAR